MSSLVSRGLAKLRSRLGREPAALLVAIALMFIGASPGSTGGGVKTVVFSLTVLATVSIVGDAIGWNWPGGRLPKGMSSGPPR